MKLAIKVVVLIQLFAGSLFAQDHVIDSTRVYSMEEITQPPLFPGGEQELLRFLAENIRYPEKARLKAIQGIVAVGFTIDEAGQVSDIRLIKNIGYGCGKEVQRVASLMPAWAPGEIDGDCVKVDFILPVRFALE